MREDELACLARLAEEWKFPLSPEITKRVIEFCRLLIAWNVRVNLTGARTVAEVVGEHVVDAFAMARLVPPGSSVVDVGAGGGLPGVAFAILRPDARLTMVEPRAKRVAFLRTAVRERHFRRVNGSASVKAWFGPAGWCWSLREMPGVRSIRPCALSTTFAMRQQAGKDYGSARSVPRETLDD